MMALRIGNKITRLSCHSAKLHPRTTDKGQRLLSTWRRKLLSQNQPCQLRRTTLLRSHASANHLHNHFTQKGAMTEDTQAIADNKASYELVKDGKELIILHTTGRVQKFNAIWLRHNCQCVQCVEPNSKQRRKKPTELGTRHTIKSVRPSSDGHLTLSWLEDDHTGIISLSYLQRHGYSAEERKQLQAARRPSVLKDSLPTLQHRDIVDSERGLWNWLSSLNDFGATLIKDVPTEDGAVQKVAELVSNVTPTIYGKIFDVISTPQPINIAYSSEDLGFHMDLVYYESPPGIQLLHCVRFDECVEGGETIVVDAWHVAEQLRKEYPEDFRTLTRVPATFQKHHFQRKEPVYMTYQKPHIVLGHTGEITNVRWAPPFEGPLCVAEEEIEPYYQAYHRLAEMLESSETKIRFRMRLGDVLAFNNRRILHSREEFNLNGGRRHLQGCYLNIDEFKSKVEVLSKKYTDGQPAKNVFNESTL